VSVPVQLVEVFGPGVVAVAIVAREVRAYRRERSPARARAAMVRYAPAAARRHGSRRPVPPEPGGDA
jgi:hypothetical protein